jgi:hypothetical protein
VTDSKRLFESIRAGNCILWVGAGFSKYAGYPLGNEIATYLNNMLGENRCPEGMGLKDVAGTYEKIYGRHQLLHQIAENFFSATPKSTEFHDILARIPYFKLILTTNYDFLLEQTHKDNLLKIIMPADFMKIRDGQAVLVKLHGDFSDPEHLVITDPDYVRFLNETSRSLLYNYVRNELALHHVIFVGYSFGDLNALSLFEKINTDLAKKRKEWFLVAPGLKEYQVNDFKVKNITCIDFTGEEFIPELERHINKNIISDLHRGLPPKIFQQYLFHRGLSPVVEFGLEGQKLRELKAMVDKATLKFTMKTTKEAALQLKKISIGEAFASLSLTEPELKEFKMEINGIAMSHMDDIVELRISSNPFSSEDVDIRYGDNLIEDALYEIFDSQKALGFRITYENFQITLNFTKPLKPAATGTIKCIVSNVYSKLSRAFKIADLTMHATQGKVFQIVRQTESFPLQLPYNEKGFEHAQVVNAHFKHLEIIEQYYGIQFRDFNVSGSEMQQASKIVAMIKGDILPYENIRGTFDRSAVDLQAFKEINIDNPTIKMEVGTVEPQILYGRELQLDNLVIEIFDTVIKNLNEFMDKKTNEVCFESKTRRIQVQIHRH